MPVTYAIPMTLVMRTQTCDYCEKKSERWINTYSRLHGIKCCGEHEAFGERDVNAWLRDQEMVLQKDFLAVHPQLRDMKFNVPRTDGSLTPDGNLSLEPFQILHKDDSGWRIRVLFTDPTSKEVLNKAMKLSDMDKSGITDAEITAWVGTLDNFYKLDQEAHKAAVLQGEQAREQEPSFIGRGYANGQAVRFFKPQ